MASGGAVLVPGAQPISEWQSPINGFIATCVEAAQAVITGVEGVLPTTPATTLRLARDQIARGEASPTGATNWANASAQLTRIGIPNTAYGPGYVHSHDWTQLVNQALAQGKPVLFGVPRAFNLQDAITGARPDAGVWGHGLTFVGIQPASGSTPASYLVADPNTAPGSGFMHYTASDLQSAGIDSLVIPNSAPNAVQVGAAPSAYLPTSLGTSGSANLSVSIPQLQTIWGGLGSEVIDAGVRIALFAFALLFIAIALGAFFFGGSGRTVLAEGAKAGAKKAGEAAVTAVTG